MATNEVSEFVRMVGRGVRDFFLFTLVVLALLIALGFVSETTRDDPRGLLVHFSIAFAMFIALVSIPGLILHRVLVRRREREGPPVPRARSAILALVILLTGLWWIVWMTWSDGADTLWVAGVVGVASPIYGAIVPRRDPSTWR